MKVVIDISEERYKDIQRIAEVQLDRRTDTVEQIVAKGTPIEKTYGDLISRTDLLNKIFQQAEGRDYYGYNMLNLPYVDLIKSMPTITAEPKTAEWISVTEKLPKPFTLVNATCRSLVDDREDWVIETLYLPIPKEANKNGYSDWGNIPMLNWGEAEVIAWVERIIPEPYKAESEEEK